jgi:benzylsuccinate CoA-transferase BbsE subunit
MRSELMKGFRMLDLADEKGALCGKIFADLGAEVIKIEPPGGCSTRSIPPFLEDLPGPDRSLYAIAYHAGKKSITVNLDATAGQRLFRDLAKKSDFIVESFPLGYMEDRAIGYDALEQLNPRIIHTTITPFGDKGPGSHYKAADIVTWAAGGMMFQMGEENRPPLQMAQPQAGLHAGAEAAVASLIAHYPREIEGRGQRAIVNMQACVVWTLMNEQAMPLLHGDYLRRSGVFTGAIGGRRKTVFKCKDGYVSGLIAGGPYLPSTNALISWMKEDGTPPDWLTKEGGLKALTPAGFMNATPEMLKELEDAEAEVERFLCTKTKREIWENILKRRILAAPVATVSDIASDPQLKARDYFVEIESKTLGRKFTLPGAFAKLSRTPIGPQGTAPKIGEHNREIYAELLGLNASDLTRLHEAGAI